MLRRLILIGLLAAGPALWAQVDASAIGGGIDLSDQDMMTPPPISGASYPSIGLSEDRSNFVALGLNFTTAYVDNVLAGELSKPVSAEMYSILPDFKIAQLLPRHHRTLSYGAGFAFYDPTSTLNQVEQHGEATYDYRWTPRVAVTVRDSFLQSSNAFSGTSTVNTGISGVAGSEYVVTPFASRITNNGSGSITYQYGLNGMIGASGGGDVLDYPHPSEAVGLSNSVTGSASGFYSRRFSRGQYLGLLYSFRHYTTSPVDSTTVTHTYSTFYTFYLRRNVSFSVDAGAEDYETSGTGLTTTKNWTPNVTASMGWQSLHSSFVLRFSRNVSGGGGLIGSYVATSGGASYNQQLTRFWNADASGAYLQNSNQPELGLAVSQGGHSITAAAGLQRRLRERFSIRLGYDYIHARYDGISALANDPNSNRVYCTLAYHFTRPIGR
jgi:hypothetical protein